MSHDPVAEDRPLPADRLPLPPQGRAVGIAPKIVDEIFEFLHRLTTKGAGLLLVEQYVTRALALADYVYIMNRGQIAYRGEPSELAEEDVFTRYLGTDVGAGH